MAENRNGSYDELGDEQLLKELANGNDSITDYLCNKYKHLVTKKANALYLIGAEKDDLIQEGMIGLFKAIRDFDATKEASFYHFAEICIQRQMYHAIEASQRLKHVPLNSYVSFSEEASSQSGVTLGEVLESDGAQNPERIMIQQEDYQDFFHRLETVLSPMEREVCNLYLQGLGYRQIARVMNKSPKAIDNALQRIRKKV